MYLGVNTAIEPMLFKSAVIIVDSTLAFYAQGSLVEIQYWISHPGGHIAHKSGIPFLNGD